MIFNRDDLLSMLLSTSAVRPFESRPIRETLEYWGRKYKTAAKRRRKMRSTGAQLNNALQFLRKGGFLERAQGHAQTFDTKTGELLKTRSLRLWRRKRFYSRKVWPK